MTYKRHSPKKPSNPTMQKHMIRTHHPFYRTANVAVFAHRQDAAFADIANAVERGKNLSEFQDFLKHLNTVVMETGSVSHQLSQLFWIVKFIETLQCVALGAIQHSETLLL